MAGALPRGGKKKKDNKMLHSKNASRKLEYNTASL